MAGFVPKTAQPDEEGPTPLVPGNIDLKHRPIVKNADGSISTVRSMGVNIGGKEVLIPTVSDDGRIMSDDEAVDTHKRTGKHLGMFRTPEESTAYAERLHEDQADMYVPKSEGFTPKSAQPDDPEESHPGAQTVRAALAGGLSNIGVDPAKAASQLEAWGSKLTDLGGDSLDTLYNRAQAVNGPMYDAAKRDHPVAKSVGEVIPAMAAPSRAVLQGGMGAIRGYTNSDADGVGGKLKDAALEAGLSAGGTAAGNYIGGKIAGSGLAKWLGGKSAAAEADQVAKQAALKAKGVARASGAMGTPAAQVMRADEVLRATMQDMAPSSRVAAEALLNSPEWTARRVAAGERYLEQAPEFLSKFDESAEALAAAHAVDPAAQAAEKLASPFKTEVLPRLKKYATRAIPAYLGQEVAGEMGGGTNARAAGGLIGFGAGAALGDPGTTVANMLKSPGFRKGAADLGLAGVRGAARGTAGLAKLLGVTSEDEAEALLQQFLADQK